MTSKETLAKPVDEATAFLKKVCKKVPRVAVVLGSGVSVLEALEECSTYPFHEVFGVSPSVEGHSGSLTVGRLPCAGSDELVAVFRGRFHLYEGHDWSVVTLPAQVVANWGIPYYLLTNAAGGLNRTFSVGDLMVLTGYRDHLGPELRQTGLLPALSAPPTNVCNRLSDLLLATGKKLEAERSDFHPLRQGVYAALLGPNYETMAEIEMLRRLKADAVGMSTVPELRTVKGTQTMAAAVSVITNVWREDQPMGGHEEVLEASKKASARLDLLFRTVIGQL
ncbi:MAG TPA: purine-nucleoside phosphorylase [Candidatus Obscuribacterales bacterium]